MAITRDFLIIGGGIAGAAAGWALSPFGRVAVLEQESQPGYHATGRSAALFTTTYGPPLIRRLASLSRAFLQSGGDGLVDHPLLTPRGSLLLGRPDQEDAVERAFTLASGAGLSRIERVSGPTLAAIAPMLRPDYGGSAVWEAEAADMDVHGLHQGFLRGLTRNGGSLVTDARVEALSRDAGGVWTAATHQERWQAPVVVNAAGAWADAVAGLAGLAPLGLVPLRRTALLVDPVFAPEDTTLPGTLSRWPMIIDVDEAFYFKPDAGRVLLSPADQTPSPPCDAQPEELDVAEAVDRVERAVRFHIRRVAHKWAGLRSFFPDHLPVVGDDPRAPGFFWLAGQGGYGIKTSPALGRLTAALVTGAAWPADAHTLGIDPADLAPERISATVTCHTNMRNE